MLGRIPDRKRRRPKDPEPPPSFGQLLLSQIAAERFVLGSGTADRQLFYCAIIHSSPMVQATWRARRILCFQERLSSSPLSTYHRKEQLAMLRSSAHPAGRFSSAETMPRPGALHAPP